MQGRRFWLAYVLYYNESYGTLKGALEMAKALMPTDIFVNVGVWLHWSKPGCEKPGHEGSDHDGTACPPMPHMCEEFKQSRNATSPFRMWWNTPVPSMKNGTLTEVLGDGHHLNVRERCSLDDSQVRCCELLQPAAHAASLFCCAAAHSCSAGWHKARGLTTIARGLHSSRVVRDNFLLSAS